MKDLKKSIKTLAPIAHAIIDLETAMTRFENMEEHLDALDTAIRQAQEKFDKLADGAARASKREQDALQGIAQAEYSARQAIENANAEIVDKKRLAAIEIEKMFKVAKDEYTAFIADNEVRKRQAQEELYKIEAVIEARKKDHQAVEASLGSIRKRIDA